jgi:hypothetical protein
LYTAVDASKSIWAVSHELLEYFYLYEWRHLMKYIIRSIVVMLVLSGFLLSACGGQIPVTGEKVVPSSLEPIDGTELSRVILTEKAAQRIGVETAPVKGKTIPYAALIYDTEGNTWVYTSPAPLTFVREPVVVDFIDGDLAYLSEALDPDLKVVTVGVAELYGTETGVSK